MSINGAISKMGSVVFSTLRDLTVPITVTRSVSSWDNAADRYVVSSSSSQVVEAIVVPGDPPEDGGRRSLTVYLRHDTPVEIDRSITVTIDGVDYNVVDGNWAHKLSTEPYRLVLGSGG